MKLFRSRAKTAAIAVREGDLLCIPVDDSFVAAKVLWVSDRQKNVTGIAVYARRFTAPVTVLDGLSDYAVLKMGRDDVTVVYPSVENVTKKKIWTVIGHRPLDDADRMLRRHIIGSSLYDGDDEIRRPATGEDYALFPRVLTVGHDNPCHWAQAKSTRPSSASG